MISITIPFTYTAFGPKKGRVERSWAVVDTVEVEIEEASSRDVEGALTIRRQGTDPIEMPVMNGRAWLPIQENDGRSIDAARLAGIARHLHATTVRGKTDDLRNDGLLDGSWHRDAADLKHRGRTVPGDVRELCESNRPERRDLAIAKAGRCVFLDGMLHTSRFEPFVSLRTRPTHGFDTQFMDVLGNGDMRHVSGLVLRPDAAVRSGFVHPDLVPLVGDIGLVDWSIDDRGFNISQVASRLAHVIGSKIGESAPTRRVEAETLAACLTAHHRRYRSDARFDPEAALVECLETISFLRRFLPGPDYQKETVEECAETLDLLRHCGAKPDTRPILDEDDMALGVSLDGIAGIQP